MSWAQALAIAAAALVCVEPQLPARAFDHAAAISARIEARLAPHWAGSANVIGAVPDSACMGRGKLMM
jgi:hypothetical protein